MTPAARDLRIDDYAYPLPDDRIARYPLADRASSKLLQYREGQLSDHVFRDLPDLLPPGTLLVGNQTRVIHARLHFPVGTGDRTVEIFLLEPLQPHDHARALGSRKAVTWKCLIGGNRRWKKGPLELSVPTGGQPTVLTAERGEREENTFAVTLSWSDDRVSFGELLLAAGSLPLPPYLGREAEANDLQRYQTVFAEREGSVAAPTAALHFTPEVLQRISDRGVNWQKLTLHVGAGTFKPVTSATLGDHVMHREYFSVPLSVIEELYAAVREGRPVVSIGTTSMRCLESLFYFGAEVLLGGDPVAGGGASVDQWVASDRRFSSVNTAPALAALIKRLVDEGKTTFDGHTQLLLTPAVRPRVVDGLITNFHQPRSTLLLLVASLVGDHWSSIYDRALAGGYRFLSYGDSSLLWRRRAGT